MNATTFRYLAAFSCLGSDCPDHCCKDWSITLDSDCKKALEEQRTSHKTAVRRIENAVINRGGIATVRLNEKNECTLLEASGHCLIHRTLGPQCLPKACATYPRSFIDDGAGVLLGEISCPEIARLLLTVDDALDSVAITQTEMPVQIIRTELGTESAHLRQNILSLLMSGQDIFDAIRGVAELLKVDVRETSHTTDWAENFLNDCRGTGNRAELTRLIERCWTTRSRSHDAENREVELTLQRQNTLREYTTRLTINHWMNFSTNNPLQHHYSLLCQLALLLLLLPIHPAVTSTTNSMAQLSQPATEIVYIVARAVERTSPLTTSCPTITEIQSLLNF